MQSKNFLELFKVKKPVIGMLHLKGDDDEDIFKRFKKELEIFVASGIDAVIVETYFGKYHNLEQALEYLSIKKPILYGVNCLNIDHMGFYLGKKYSTAFIQVDSVVGHVKPRDEETLQNFFDLERSDYKGYLLGGVRFKYQPLLSKNTLEEDLKIAQKRCDAICVTEDATGQETSIKKIKEFRNNIGDFPLIVAAGVTPENIKKAFEYADGAIIGSYFKDNYKDDGEVSEEHVLRLIKKVKEIRGQIND